MHGRCPALFYVDQVLLAYISTIYRVHRCKSGFWFRECLRLWQRVLPDASVIAGRVVDSALYLSIGGKVKRAAGTAELDSMRDIFVTIATPNWGVAGYPHIIYK